MQQMEKVMYVDNAPGSVDPDGIFFVQVDASLCQACGECESHCATGAIQPINEKGIRQVIHPAACMNCGQCLINCPYGAIYEGVSFVNEVFKKLKDPDTIVVSMPAPAVRYGLAEAFGEPTGTYAAGKMHAALKAMGFDYVWDNEFTADVTIMEEGTELIQRISKPDKEKPLPQFTSCCPGWIKFVESFYPDLMPHLSTCKSPIAMLGPWPKLTEPTKPIARPKKSIPCPSCPVSPRNMKDCGPKWRTADSGTLTPPSPPGNWLI